jgi:phage gp36-like protein
MSAALIAQLLATFGPSAIQWISQLVALAEKPSVTTADIQAVLATAQTSYDTYVSNAKASLTAPHVTAAATV